MRCRFSRHLLGMGLLVSCLLTGCSFSNTMQSIVNTVTDDAEAEPTVIPGEGKTVEAQVIDTSLEKPVFQDGLLSICHVPIGGQAVLETQASVQDGGSISYQWFSNNVAVNGGGTAIPDATDARFTADTSQGGTTFYYVVASNRHEDRVNKATSGIYEVTVWEDMYWQQNADLGAYQYISRVDGKYPTDATMEIDGKTYHFDAEGFAIMEDGAYLDVQTGEAVPTPTPEPTETPTPTPTPEPTEEQEEEVTEEPVYEEEPVYTDEVVYE